MIDLNELSQLVAFADLGTLSRVAEEFHISTPSITRSMLPVIRALCLTLGCAPYLLYFGLLTGATLGGNLTPIGASANIAGIGILRKAGYEVKTKDFLRIGVPFTLCAVIVGYLFCWFVWS